MFFLGNTVYHLAATLNAMANPLMAFLAMFLPCNSRRYGHSLSHLVIIYPFNTVYQLAATLNAIANPLMSFSKCSFIQTAIYFVQQRFYRPVIHLFIHSS